MGERGVGEGGRFKWFSGCNMLTVIFFLFFFFSFSFILFLSIYILLSLSPQQRKKKKKNACTRTPKFLCIFLRNARPAPPRPPPHTQMVILSNVLIQASVPGVCVGGGRLAPNWVPMLEKKGRRKAPKQCVTTLNIE